PRPGRWCRAARSKTRKLRDGTRQNRWYGLSSRVLLAAARIEQEFAIAIRAEDRAFDNPDYTPARLCGDPRRGTLADFAMHCGIAHHSALADLRAAHFELRLDERHQLGALDGERERGGQ